jgi:hemerythrin
MDADDFKTVNDTYGHDAGDAVLRELGAALKLGFRAGDAVCRLGGDEFLAICPRTPASVAAQVGERLRAGLASRRIAAGGGEWKGSLSVGIASLETGAEELLKAADQALYEAKHLGRNRVVVQGAPA